MIKFTLPNFYHYKNLNNVIYHYTHVPNSTLFKFGVQGEEGSLPFFSSNGGVNINYGFCDYYFITELEKMVNLPLYFDYTNKNIQDIDLLNVKDNLLLSANMTATNGIIVSDYGVMKYLKTKYPFYHFIASEDFIFPDNIDRNQVLEEITRFRIAKEEDIAKYPLNKIEFILPTTRCFLCSKYNQCKNNEQSNISDFRNQSVFRTCTSHGPYFIECIELFNHLKDTYNISNFCFETRGLPIHDFNYLIDFYTMFFIAPEFKSEVEQALREASY